MVISLRRLARELHNNIIIVRNETVGRSRKSYYTGRIRHDPEVGVFEELMEKSSNRLQ